MAEPAWAQGAKPLRLGNDSLANLSLLLLQRKPCSHFLASLRLVQVVNSVPEASVLYIGLAKTGLLLRYDKEQIKKPNNLA